MLEKLKIDFYNLIAGLGFSISDTRNYEDNKSPWLMLRTGGYQRSHSLDVKTSKITLVLDIFSQYNGEREIIQAVEKIADNIDGFISSHPEILVCQQKTMRILDDKATGPVRKHGVVSYEFLLGEEDAREEPEENE